ncbi:MAG: hypothetical protein HY731_01060, partial [Candidatus Tectomicrobia bacterium]|nr:hypothetical protein [Candidatus Tectomicrobia bacterium]
MSIPYNFQTDWSRMAKLIVHDALKTTAGEQVLIHADPTYFPELTEQIRIELNKAGAVELATVLFFSPGLATVRQQLRRREDPTVKALEDHAMAALFDLADIYIWLPTIWSLNAGQTEKILETWKGRSIHFHWIGRDVTDSELFRKLSEMYDEALYIDYETLTARQKQLIETLRGCTVRITNPAGTDLTLEIPASAHFHLGNG